MDDTDDDFTHYFNATQRLSGRVRDLRTALERINECACYTEENQDARDKMLLAIGNTARDALANPITQDGATASAPTPTVTDHSPASLPESSSAISVEELAIEAATKLKDAGLIPLPAMPQSSAEMHKATEIIASVFKAKQEEGK